MAVRSIMSKDLDGDARLETLANPVIQEASLATFVHFEDIDRRAFLEVNPMIMQTLPDEKIYCDDGVGDAEAKSFS